MKGKKVIVFKVKSIIYISVSIICSASFFISCSGDAEAGPGSATSVIPAVEAVETRYGSLPLTQRLSGIVEAENQVEIFPELSAVIVEVNVKDGDPVRRGQALVRLRDNEFQERLKQAQAGYQIALAQQQQAEAKLITIESDLKRIEKLAEQGLTSITELETAQTNAISARADVALAKARVEQAKATVDERKETLSQTIVRSPVDGSVGNRNAEVGMLVNGNTKLFTLGQLDNVRIKVVLSDRMIQYIREGQRVEIIDENVPEGIIDAKLSRISPFLNPVTHSTDAEIDLENKEGLLKPGMFVTVDIFYGESEQATIIPLSALFENPSTGATGVYVTDATFNIEMLESKGPESKVSESEPVDFVFIPVDIIAKGRMEAGINGVDPEKWIITIGQNLIGGSEGKARVRPVKWMWVEKLQKLQREDLMKGLF